MNNNTRKEYNKLKHQAIAKVSKHYNDQGYPLARGAATKLAMQKRLTSTQLYSVQNGPKPVSNN